MPEPEARRRAIYDHADDDPRVTGRSRRQVTDADSRTAARSRRQVTDDDPRPVGRSRRQVADWGVGEELFDGMPGRRFDRRGPEHGPSRGGSTPRGGAADGRRTIVITEDDVRLEDEAPAEEFARREDALEARRRHDEVWAGDEPFAEEPARDPYASAIEAFAPGGRFAEEPPARPRSEPDGIARGGIEGRRTVKIGGRPAEFHPSPARRSSRTIHERLGPRPDRIAAWAFALGILLILIAVATANI
jgi:hypothetical protein